MACVQNSYNLPIIHEVLRFSEIGNEWNEIPFLRFKGVFRFVQPKALQVNTILGFFRTFLKFIKMRFLEKCELEEYLHQSLDRLFKDFLLLFRLNLK